LKAKKMFLMALMLCSSGFALQDSLAEKGDNDEKKIDEKSFMETKKTVDKLKKLKISGYVQAQMRIATDAEESGEKKL